jgi:hypothetical protein
LDASFLWQGAGSVGQDTVVERNKKELKITGGGRCDFQKPQQMNLPVSDVEMNRWWSLGIKKQQEIWTTIGQKTKTAVVLEF